MKLSALCRQLPLLAPFPEAKEQEIADLCTDSRKAETKDLFFALEGQVDGHAFLPQAYRKGCRAFVVSHPVELPADSLLLFVSDTREAFALACRAFFRLSKPLHLIGITGTKGKTTVATYAARLYAAQGKKVIRIGTGGIWDGAQHIPQRNTTPDAYTLFRTLSAFSASGGEVAVIEVSSQAYYQHRVTGLRFDLGIFTNFYPDHIGVGEHPDLSHYLNCKLQLFRNSAFGILNRNDPQFPAFAAACHGSFLTYGRDAASELWASELSCRPDGISFRLHTKNTSLPLSLPLPGIHNMDNALAVCALAHREGIPLSSLAAVFSQGVAGRSERYLLPGDRVAIIDYAHNPASMEAILQTLRPHCRRKLICLFGSVGGRCHARREALGRVAGNLADRCILTADDPGWEDPVAIAQDIARGIPESCPYEIIADRTEAILFALESMEAGDLLLLAGKGAERGQRIAGQTLPFSERDLLRQWCESQAKKQRM